MQILKLAFLFGGLMFLVSAMKPSGLDEKMKWYSLEEAEKNFKSAKRPILIDLYTDWCGWCKVMDKNTYNDPRVSAYLEKNFYAVKVNAEGRKEISFNGKKFRYNPQYRTNEFAIFLTNGQLSYPTTVIIPTDGSSPQTIPGYLEPKDFEKILKYFGEGKYGKVPFKEYDRSFKGEWNK